MKKKLSFVGLLVCGMLCSTTLLSCGDDPVSEAEQKEEQNNKDNGNEPIVDEALSSDKQKEYLETVAEEFLNITKSTDFKSIADLMKYTIDTYGEDYDWGDFSDWADDCFNALLKQVGSPITTTSSSSNESYAYTYIYKYNTTTTNFEALIYASNFHSRFTATNGRWVRSDANCLEFVFTDKSSQTCTLKVETSGNEVPVHAGVFEKKKSSYTSSQSDNTITYVSSRYYDEYDCTIGLPEHIVVTLTQNNSEVVKSTIHINLESISGQEFNVGSSHLTLSAQTVLNNGYTIDLSQVAYMPNSKASVSLALSKDSRSLVSLALSGDVSGMPSCNVSALTEDGLDAANFDNVNAKNAFAKIDILGKVQMQGTISDVRKYSDYIEQAGDSDENEATFKSYVHQANGLADINMFFNGGSTKQAQVKLEPFSEKKWNGNAYWTVEPVLYFSDGSSYSTFEAFFNENDFKKVIDHFKSLANEYADLIDEKIKW